MATNNLIFFMNPQIWIACAFTLSFTALSIIDLKTMRLPDYLTLPTIFICILFNSFSSHQFISSTNSIIGSIIGFTLLWGVDRIYFICTNKHGIGMGDGKLLAGVGALLGIHAVFTTLFLASFMGLLGGLIWLKWNRLKLHQSFPFGPYLSIAGVFLVFHYFFNFQFINSFLIFPYAK